MSASSSSVVAAADSGQRLSYGPPRGGGGGGRGRGRGGRGGGRGRGNHQYQQQQPPNSYQKFVPKQKQTIAITSSDIRPKIEENASKSRPRLTTPLRDSSSTTTTSSSSNAFSLESNVRSWGRSTAFVNYLPHDEAIAVGLRINNAGLDSVESQMAVDILNDALSWLLKLDPRGFWREVARNESLFEALDSYLLFRNRWYDLPHNGPTGVVAGVIVGEDELSRRVFMTFYRMSSNKDPDSKTRDSLSSKEHADLLRNKKLLDIPRLLDICSIYGDVNKELTRVLVSNSVKVQQISAASLTDTCHHFLQIVNTMHIRCSFKIEALTCYNNLENKDTDHFEKSLLEVMDFINDAIMSLNAFVDVYKPASLYFSLPLENSEGHCGVLSMLRKLHDSLLPSLRKGLTHISNLSKKENSNNAKIDEYSHSLRLLSMRIVNFGWKLLESCYLRDDIVEDVTLQKNAMMLPVEIDDPIIRGDILVQTLKEINGEVYSQDVTKEYGMFLQNIETKFYLLSRIDSLRSNGVIFLNDEAFHVILQIFTLSPSNTMEEVRGPVTSLTSKVSIDEDAIILESKISQIKDLFPDYGNGFLSACLDVYNQNAEEVIQRILEGTLHRDLLSLDTSLEQMEAPKHVFKNTNDKGKGVAVMESETENRRKGKGLLVESSSQFTAASSTFPSVYEGIAASEPLPFSPMSAHGRYIRKSKDDQPSIEILDSKTAKDSMRTMALAAKGNIDMYEDEYDDSFDDLGLSVVESTTEEVENEDAKTYSGGWNNSQKKTQFYVKDGKNYSYKVAGSIAVSNARDAAIINQTQRETIHGLGRGGNIPLGIGSGAKKFTDHSDEPTTNENSSNSLNGGEAGRGSPSSRGNNRGRGRGRGGGQYRKNQAMKKHFAGLTGF